MTNQTLEVGLRLQAEINRLERELAEITGHINNIPTWGFQLIATSEERNCYQIELKDIPGRFSREDVLRKYKKAVEDELAEMKSKFKQL